MEVEACEIVDERRIEEQAIQSIEYAAVSRQNVGSILCARATFERAFGEVAENSDHCHQYCEWQHVFERQFAKEPEMRERRHRECREEPANRAFPGFTGTDRGREFTFTQRASDVISACVSTHQH